MRTGSAFRELSAELGFSGNRLDRLSDRRDDAAFVDALCRDAAARTLIIVRDTPVLKRTGTGYMPWFDLGEAQAVGPGRETALLGRLATGPVFATLLDDAAAVPVPEGAAGGRPGMVIAGRDDLALIDMRSVAVQGLVGRDDVAMLAGAKSLLHWHARHRFCPNCGAPSSLAAAGWRRECATCKALHFPRTDPVVIMLATDGDNCLLGRQARFGKGMYSALAGFLEPGETVEEAVRREVREESGIEIGEVTYLASQPWPFPSSLMIGCLARATSREIVVDRTELEDARWFTRGEVRQMFAGTHPDGLTPPQPLAIAHHLLRFWSA
jgi:NAD+ diphosphatase